MELPDELVEHIVSYCTTVSVAQVNRALRGTMLEVMGVASTDQLCTALAIRRCMDLRGRVTLVLSALAAKKTVVLHAWPAVDPDGPLPLQLRDHGMDSFTFPLEHNVVLRTKAPDDHSTTRWRVGNIETFGIDGHELTQQTHNPECPEIESVHVVGSDGKFHALYGCTEKACEIRLLEEEFGRVTHRCPVCIVIS